MFKEIFLQGLLEANHVKLNQDYVKRSDMRTIVTPVDGNAQHIIFMDQNGKKKKLKTTIFQSQYINMDDVQSK
jgi:hypothetical protein